MPEYPPDIRPGDKHVPPGDFVCKIPWWQRWWWRFGPWR